MSFLTNLFGTCNTGAEEVKKDDNAPISYVKKAEPKPNPSFLCPISRVLMTDPVMAMDGYSYERSAIEKWLESNDTSPQSNTKLPAKTLIPNINLKAQITEWKKMVGEAQDSGVLQAPVAAEARPLDAEEEVKESIKDVKPIGGLDIKVSGNEALVRFSVSAGEAQLKDCPPVDLVLVMDRSGSMGTAVVGVNEDTQQVMENGFSTLDLVKHAMKTCVRSLRPVDRIALILFDNMVTVAFVLTSMDKRGMNMACQKIDTVRERGSTNIYSAVQEAVKLIESRPDKSRNPSILFFTDGVPNVSPSMGELAFFKKLMKQKQLSFPIHTFGFGVWDAINSSLLYDIAKIFNGMYGYIPDATFIGTTFVNAITNILTTAAINVKVHMETSSSLDKLHVGDFNFEMKDKHMIINLGSVRYGQSVDFLVQFSSEPKNMPEYFITFDRGDRKFKSNPQNVLLKAPSPQDHLLRFETIELLKKIIRLYRTDLVSSRTLMTKHIEVCDGMKLQDKTSMGIIESLKGQNMTMLEKKKYMDKWGKHQTRQYVRSLNLQIKNNFKDSGVQHFGGKVFEELSDQIDDIFNNMPPPKPSLATVATKVVSSPRTFAKAYNNVRNDYLNGHGCSGGCFAGDGKVMMGDGSTKLVRDVCPGDILATPGGGRQVYLVRRDELSHPGCLINGLWITPKHPLRVGEKWVCPGMIQEVESCCPVTTWFNFELKGGNSFQINGLELVALGHDNVITPEDPAFCPEKDRLYGAGWKSNPERLTYLRKLPEVSSLNRRMNVFLC